MHCTPKIVCVAKGGLFNGLHATVRHKLNAALECDPENVPIFGGLIPAIHQKACSMHKWGENERQ
jgi:hypothetical protein